MLLLFLLSLNSSCTGVSSQLRLKERALWTGSFTNDTSLTPGSTSRQQTGHSCMKHNQTTGETGVCVAVGMSVRDRHLEAAAVSGEDVVLQCTADLKPGVQYRAVRWYKVQHPSSDARLSGLLMKGLPNGTTQWYTGVEREVEFVDESRDILLSNVTCADVGVYACYLAAPVGEQNREGRVLLALTDCPDIPTENLTNNETSDAYMVIAATAVLILALVIYIVSYVCLKNILISRNVPPKEETLLDAPMKPLDKNDFKLIYTLGPKTTQKHICV